MNDRRDWRGDGEKKADFDNLLHRNRVLFGTVSEQLAVHLAKMRVPPSERDDLIAEAWLNAVKHRHRFAGVEPERRLRCWLIKVVHRKALDRNRRLTKHLCEVLTSGKEEPIDEEEAKGTETAELSAWLHELLEQAGSGNETNLLLLRGYFFEGRSKQDLAQQFGMTVDAVEGRIRRLVVKLHARVEENLSCKPKSGFDLATRTKKN